MSQLDLVNELGGYFNIKKEIAQQITSFFKEETISKNDFLIKKGGRFPRLSFIKSGFLRVYLETESKEVTQWVSSPGDFVTDLSSFMFETPARWNIQAITSCELLSLDNEGYQNIKKEVKDWNQIEKLFLGKCFITFEERIFSFLSLTAEQRYKFLQEIKPELFMYVPQQYVASMLGMTPETFSRIRKKDIS